MIVYPNAKINIGLNVVEKRPDGYHNLETVFYPIGLQDILEIQEIDSDVPACGYRLKVTGTVLDGSPEDNLVVRALKLLKRDFDLPPVSIGLYKHIPTGAGLGGGSRHISFRAFARLRQDEYGPVTMSHSRLAVVSLPPLSMAALQAYVWPFAPRIHLSGVAQNAACYIGCVKRV